MKTLSDIKSDMSDLYDALLQGKVETKVAAELANIAGKYLKAEQLDLAKQIFQRDLRRKGDLVPLLGEDREQQTHQ